VDPDRSSHVLAAGSLYEGDQGEHWPNAHHVVDAHLDKEGRPTSYDVRFRAWSPEAGFWYDDSSLYRSARAGRLHISLHATIPTQVREHFEAKLLRIPPFQEAFENGADLDDLAARIAREPFKVVLRYMHEAGYNALSSGRRGLLEHGDGLQIG
jgi:hypothetical protein